MRCLFRIIHRSIWNFCCVWLYLSIVSKLNGPTRCQFSSSYIFGIGFNWRSVANWIYFFSSEHIYGMLKTHGLYTISCGSFIFCTCTIFAAIYWICCFRLGYQNVYLKRCSSKYLVIWRLYSILMQFLGHLELDTIVIVEFFEVYIWKKKVFWLDCFVVQNPFQLDLFLLK